MKKNVCLMRVSTDMQETTAQRTAIEKYIHDNKIIIHEYIEEDGVSGFKTKLEDRIGLMKIKKMALNDEIDTLLIFNSDRIGRRIELVGFINLLDECGVKIVSVTEGLLNKGEDTDSLISSVKMWMAEYESKKISERVKAGKKATALRGEFLGGVPNFGYRLANKKLEIEPEEAEIVKLLFDTYIKYGSAGVLNLFNEKGITKRGDVWTRGKIIKTLRNTIYIGDKQLKNEVIPHDEALRIVSDEVFYEAKKLMESRTTKKRGSTTKFVNRSSALLEGLLFHKCPDGNIRRLHIDYNKGTYKDPNQKKLLYRCSHCKSRRYKGVQKSYGGEKINNIIETRIKEIMSTISYDDLEEEYNRIKKNDTTELEGSIQSIEKYLNKKTLALKNASKELEKIFMGESCMDKETINNIIISLKKDIEENESLLIKFKDDLNHLQLKNKNTYKLLDKYKDFNYLYDKATDLEKKIILQEIVDKIVINEDNIEIKLNI